MASRYKTGIWCIIQEYPAIVGQELRILWQEGFRWNLSERGAPGKLLLHWEEQIHVIEECTSISSVYQVKPKHGHGKQRILHRNLLLPCDALPLPRQMTVMSNTTQLLSRALPQPQNPGEFPQWVWDGNIIFCSYPWNILSRGWRHPIYVPAWPPWPGGLYQYGICIN